LIDPQAPVRVVFTAPAGEAAVTVEIADTKQAISDGLAHRTELGADRGMLFFMPKQKDWAFWMQDTLIALDIVFITEDKKIAGIVHNAQPRTSDSLRVGRTSYYVLEVNGGWMKKHGILAGQRVRFDNIKE
jgi:uncharacterized membrane protein (UPF0127 family)